MFKEAKDLCLEYFNFQKNILYVVNIVTQTKTKNIQDDGRRTKAFFVQQLIVEKKTYLLWKHFCR